MSKPNLLILGPSRSATTSLFYLLGQHKDIFLPRIKEPKFFTSNPDCNPRNGPGDKLLVSTIVSHEKDYLNLYKNASNYKVSIDASSDYFFYFEYIKERLKSFFPSETRVIVVLRDPAERAFSSYMNLVRDGRYTNSFKEYEENQKFWYNNGYDQMWLGFYGSLYSSRIKQIADVFPNLKIVSFSRFKKDTNQVMSEILSFLELDDILFKDVNIKYSRGADLVGFKLFTSRKNILISKFRDLAIRFFGRRQIEIILNWFLNKDQTSAYQISEEWKNKFARDKENLINEGIKIEF